MSVSQSAEGAKGKAKVLLLDDHPVIREGLIQILSKEPDLEVCAEAGNCREALHLSVKTIETYRMHIKDKLGLPDATALRQRAIQWRQERDLL